MTIRVISLGWGVQSWTLCAMAALGDLDVTLAIHADTGFERQATYAFAEKWTPWLVERGIEVVTAKNPKAGQHADQWGGVFIPAFTSTPTAGGGVMRRQCTNRWKIEPVKAEIRKRLPKNPKPGSVQMVMGISMDEWSRMRSSDVKYIENVYPLIEKKMTRKQCVEYLLDHKLPVPIKSSCTFCPYHGHKAWDDLYRQGGADMESAERMDAAIRKMRPPFDLFVHRDRIPLRDALAKRASIADMQPSFLQEEDDGCATGFCFV